MLGGQELDLSLFPVCYALLKVSCESRRVLKGTKCSGLIVKLLFSGVDSESRMGFVCHLPPKVLTGLLEAKLTKGHASPAGGSGLQEFPFSS